MGMKSYADALDRHGIASLPPLADFAPYLVVQTSKLLRWAMDP